MPKYTAFLRAVNLASKRAISGAELRSAFEGLGFEEVATFRNSGNVVFSSGREPAGKLTGRIEAGLAEAAGFEVPVFLRTAAEVLAIAGHEPFDPGLVETSEGKLQVALLSAKPGAGAREQVEELATDEDRLAFGPRELYWLPSGQMRDASIDPKAFDRLLGSTTMRTKGTIEQLAGKYFSD